MTRVLDMECVESWRARGLRLGSGDEATLASPDDTNSFALLVRQAVETLQPETVLDVGCGCGIPTVEAAESGASQVVGIDVAKANVALARQNVTRAGLAHRVLVHHRRWEDASAADISFDLVVANPPYLPSASGVAVDGGPDGTRMLQAIVSRMPASASGLALLFGSVSNPLEVLGLLAGRGWSVQSLFAHVVPFGRYTSTPAMLRVLHRQRLAGTAWFGRVDGLEPVHAYVVLGVVAKRGRAPRGLAEALRAALEAFQRFGPDALDEADLPVPFETASYLLTAPRGTRSSAARSGMPASP